MIWRLPGAQTRITTPGSALLFPSLLAPTPPRHRYGHPRTTEPAGDRTAKMPTRTRTREQNRAARITAERTHNRQERRARHAEAFGTPPPNNDTDPPPF